MSKSQAETPRLLPHEIRQKIEDFKEDIKKPAREKSDKALAEDIELIKKSFVDPKLEGLIRERNLKEFAGSTASEIAKTVNKIDGREEEYTATSELRDGVGAYLRSLTHTKGGRNLTKWKGSSTPTEGFKDKLDAFFREHGVEPAIEAVATRERGGSASSAESSVASSVSADPAPSTDLPKADAKPSPAAPTASAGFAGAIKALFTKTPTAEIPHAASSDTFNYKNPIGKGAIPRGKDTGAGRGH